MDGGLRTFQSFMDSGPTLWLYLLDLIVVAPIVTFVHELGHAAAVRATVGGPVVIVVGNPDRKLVAFRLFGIEIVLAPVLFPFGRVGGCLHAGRPTAGQAATIALAGPAASALGFGAALALLPLSHGSLVWTAIVTSVGAVVLNLIPITTHDRSGAHVTFRSDGRQALDALRRLPPPVALCRCGHPREAHGPACGGTLFHLKQRTRIPCPCAGFDG